MSNEKLSDRIETVRSFNRYYTKKIGVVTERLLETPFSLPEARILFELAHNQGLNVTKLSEILQLDAGYLSRLIQSLDKKGLLKKSQSEADGRRKLLNLTNKGERAFAALNSRSAEQVRAMLHNLPEESQVRLLKAMSDIINILDPDLTKPSRVLLRTHRPGDIGWIVERHGFLYNMEYRFDETFEALVAGILAKLIKTYDHRNEHIWIAELDDKRAGTILVSRAGESTAQLRLFLTEPWARGQGIGKMLMNECLTFARQAGYKKMKLWTQSILHAARHLYETAGFKLVKSEPHHSFGHDLVAEIWEIRL